MCAYINKLTLMIDSVDTYRGHTKGFEGSILQVVALGLLWARRREGAARPDVRRRVVGRGDEALLRGEPHVRAVGDSQFATYQTNVAVDDSVFKK